MLNLKYTDIETVSDASDTLKDNCENGSIITLTGKEVTPLGEMTQDDININDIAHSLANQCRFTGHTRRFYSVAEHSFHLASEFVENWHNKELAAYALLHDASEAYLSDIPRPFKLRPEFGFYREKEKQLQAMIFRKFGLSPELPDVVEIADKLIVEKELMILMNVKGKFTYVSETDRGLFFSERHSQGNGFAALFGELKMSADFDDEISFLEMFRQVFRTGSGN